MKNYDKRISVMWKYFKQAIAVMLILCVPASAVSQHDRVETVLRVIDGDTVLVESSNKVRLIGINTPEKGMPGYAEATARLVGLVQGMSVQMNACEEKDQYGRELAVLHIGDRNVNLLMLEEGLAVPMLIPPCGTPVADEVLKSTAVAILGRKGLYAGEEFLTVPHVKANQYIGKSVVVNGRIMAVKEGKKAVHFNFGKDWRTDFTAVIFKSSLKRFEHLGIDPFEMVGKTVLISGVISEYYGPEIIIRRPEQLMTYPINPPDNKPR